MIDAAPLELSFFRLLIVGLLCFSEHLQLYALVRLNFQSLLLSIVAYQCLFSSGWTHHFLLWHSFCSPLPSAFHRRLFRLQWHKITFLAPSKKQALYVQYIVQFSVVTVAYN